jgi:hypothetical protein
MVAVLETQRDRVVKELTRHCGDGRLTLDELEERIAAAYDAETADDLRALLADLPGGGDVVPVDLPPPLPPPLPHPTPRHHGHVDKRVGLDAAKSVSTICGIVGLVLLINGAFWWAMLVWFVVPGLLIHDRKR